MASPTEHAPSPPREYTKVAKFFHWSMAAIIIIAWVIGYYGGAMLHYGVDDAETAKKVTAIVTHKNIATLTLFFVVGRLIWRATHAAPPLTEMPEIMQRLTHLGHGVLYFLMVAVPVSGWANSSSAGYNIPVLWLFDIPTLMSKSPAVTPYLVTLHWFLAWALAIVVIGHVAFALKHLLIDRDETMSAMLPRRKS
ncbi:cytochrome b [Rhodobacter lacus]|uniref:Cytochrome b n=1 Tax=Rhodobacter lacus TaxID=1641972 RepID=A0ABW5A4T9_9RHOB